MRNKSYSIQALNAMRRASKKAVEKAANLGLKVPVWKDGKIILENAEEKFRKLSHD